MSPRSALAHRCAGAHERTSKRSRLPVALAALACLAASPGEAAELRTPHYAIRITEHCPEGEVGCNDVSYVGTSLKTGRSITLKGRAVMRLCPDRVTPCHHEGYVFEHGQVEYRVMPDGSLVVRRGAELLVEERGQWQAAEPPPSRPPKGKLK